MSAKALTTMDYTIGWLAALPHEREAATAVLDEIHDPPADFTQGPRDGNIYTWGNIGPHNIVLTSLPVGTKGTLLAAHTTFWLYTAFPLLRFLLMVGIGAGIPNPTRDVRLGDVVVSYSAKGKLSFGRYDIGSEPSSQSQKMASLGLQVSEDGHAGSPGSLPLVITSTVESLRAQHATVPSAIPLILNKMISRYPTMAVPEVGRGSFCHPGVDDIIYDSTYPHAHAKGDCSECDKSRALSRLPRASNGPQIFYGGIATGDGLIKNPNFREGLTETYGEDCICLEMESSPLVGSFPCLTVRGICDYADSHKNDVWQKYAAATAAAYTREFLAVLGPQTVLDLPSIYPEPWNLIKPETSLNSAGAVA